MDFTDALRSFAKRVDKLRTSIQTEEATKTSLIMPFFQQVFGYDVFNPQEFVPEFTADVGIKKGEKVDYAIFIDDKPMILIEAKWCGEPLDKHDSQLFRYFGTTTAKFGILTNGIVYKFYTDLEEQNKMDLKPFLELDLLGVKDSAIAELKQFCKANFDADEAFGRASELKHSNEIRRYFTSQLADPSDDFVKFMLSQTYDGTKTAAVVEKFKPIIKATLSNIISELMNERITAALKRESSVGADEDSDRESAPIDDAVKSAIVTTELELQAFYIVRAILAECIDVTRIGYRDTTNYFSVILDDMPTKWICRLKVDSGKKYLAVPGEEKGETRMSIDSIESIYSLKDPLRSSLSRLLQ